MRRSRRRQRTFAFADSPQGGKDDRRSDVSEGKAYLLHTAKAEEAHRPDAAADEEHLLERAASSANLAKALLHVASKRGAPGEDGVSVKEVVENSRQILPRLRRELRSGTYEPGDVRRAWIPKPGGGQRGLGIPNVVDRWVQQALHQVLGPIFDPTFHPCSHGFRPGRGARTALNDVKPNLQEGFVWLVNIDLSKFFDRVHHQRLLARLSGRVVDGRILKLVNRFLKAKAVMPDGVRVSPTEGTPQGGPLSPLLSNIVLDELDWELERRGLRFVRYADDFLVFVRSERAAYRVLGSLTRFIERRLRLKVNRDKSGVTRPDDTHFLGFRFELGSDGPPEVHLSKRSVDRLNDRLRELTPRTWGRPLAQCMEGVDRYIRGWVGHFRLLTVEGAHLLRRFDAHVRRRLRAIVIRQRKRGRHLRRHLLLRGVSHAAANGTAFRRRGPWYRSNLPGMRLAYPVSWFEKRMGSLYAKWLRKQPAWPALVQLDLFPD